MKILKKFLLLALCPALLFGLAACTGGPEQVSSDLPESSLAPVSSEPPAESAWFVPAKDLIPDSPEEGAEGFEADFSQNPIDKAYDESYAQAMSFSAMRQACDEAAQRWRDMVDLSYDAALELLSGEEREALRDEQSLWLSEIEGRVKKIWEEAGDHNEGILNASKEIVLTYRQRAMELCRVKYEQDGTLPDFPEF